MSFFLLILAVAFASALAGGGEPSDSAVSFLLLAWLYVTPWSAAVYGTTPTESTLAFASAPDTSNPKAHWTDSKRVTAVASSSSRWIRWTERWWARSRERSTDGRVSARATL